VRSGDGGHVVRDDVGDVVCVLNETALALWQLCDGETDPSEMVEAILQLADADESTVESDVVRGLTELVDAGLITWRHDDAAQI
jgi:hypothetical protein